MNDGLPAIVLAAGFGRRWNEKGDKLLYEIDGVPVLRRTVDALRTGGIGPICLVVRRSRQAALADALGGVTALHWIENAQAEAGMGSSLAAGVRALTVADASRGFAVAPGDLPQLRPAEVFAICAQFVAGEGAHPVRPVYDGRPGHPVLFPAAWRERLMRLRGDVGGRELLRASDCRTLEVDHPGVVADLDQRAS